MIQRKLVDYTANTIEHTIDKEILKKLKKIAKQHSIQYALLWYIYLVGEADLRKLHRVYKDLSGKLVRENTVRKQLQILERKGLIKRQGDKYIALIDPRDVKDLFDTERSRSGKIGATIRHMKLNTKSLKISPGLTYYTKQVIEGAKKLVKRGKKTTALDLIAHTLLPLRERMKYYGYGTKTSSFTTLRSQNQQSSEQ